MDYYVVFVVLQTASLAVGCLGLYCFIRVFLAMREHGEPTLAMFCLVTLLLGVGGAIAFVYGIIKSRDWEIAPTMMLWGTCVAVNLVLLGAALALPGSS
jgi:hypothetical protein